MKFGLDIEIGQKKTVKPFIEAGIQENVFITNISCETSDKGTNYLKFDFEKDGKTVSHTEYEPTTGNGRTEEETDKKKVNQYKRIGQILVDGLGVAREKYVFDTTSWLQFAKEVVALLPVGYDKIPLKVKFTYKGAFVDIPLAVSKQFIAKMESTEANLIQWGNLGDTLTPVTADSEPATPKNPILDEVDSAFDPTAKTEEADF